MRSVRRLFGNRRLALVAVAIAAAGSIGMFVSVATAAPPACTDTYTANSVVVGDDWSDTANWTSGAPGSSTIACWSGTITVDSGSQSAAAVEGGTLSIGGGSLAIGSSSNASTLSGDLDITGGALTGDSPLTLSGNFDWSGQATLGGSGTSGVNITQTGGGTFSISGSGQNYFTGGSIQTSSNVTISDLNFIAANSPTLTTTGTVSFATGNYTANGGVSLTISAAGFVTTGGSSKTAALANYGLHLTGSSSSLAANLSTPAFSSDSGSSITIPTGLTLSSGGGTISGTVTGAGTFANTGGTSTIASGGTLSSANLDVSGGTLSAASGSTFTVGSGAGTGTTVSSGTLSIGATSASTQDLTLSGGSLDGPGGAGSGGTLAVTGNFSWNGGGELGGTTGSAIAITQTGGGSFSISGTNQNYFTGGSIQTSSNVTISDLNFIAANSPTLTTTGTVSFASGNYTANGGVSLTISAAGFVISDDTALPNYGLVLTGGTTTVAVGDTLSPGALAIHGGTLQVDGTLDAPPTVTGGTLAGTGTVNGQLDQTGGTLNPGDAPGTLTINGDYNQGSGATLAIAVDGTTAGQFSSLQVNGNVDLAGTLSMRPGGSYASSATPGDTIDIMNYVDDLSGAFATTNTTPPLHEGETFSPDYVGDSGSHINAVVGAAQPPVSTSGPVVSGNTVVGDKLSTTNGSWTNNPTSFTYQWEDCTSAAATTCANVATGGTGSSYTLTSADLGKYVTVIVTAHNAAATAGTATGQPVKGPITALALTKPVNTAAPSISGTPAAGRTLTCGPGSWSPAATSYAYTWSASGTPIIGATSGTYKVQDINEGLTITCTVIASNAGGSSAPATSAGVKVPIPVVAHCPAATGKLGGTTLGLLRLGMSRAQARHAYSKSSNRGKAYIDFFCLTPRGVRAGYASPKLVKTLPKSKRGKLAGHVIWASTSNGYYSVKGIRPGATLAAARAALPGGNYFRVGLNYWYLAPNGGDTAVLKLRGGVVQEIGIGMKSLTTGLKAQKIFMTSFE